MIIFWCGEQVFTWIIVLLTFIIAYWLLEDWTVIDLYDPEDDNGIQQQSIRELNETLETEIEGYQDGSIVDHVDATPAKPMVKPHLLRRWFPNHHQSNHHEEDETQHQEGNDEGTEARRLPNYKMYRTQYTRSNEGNTSLCAGVLQILNQLAALLRMRSTWRGILGLSSSLSQFVSRHIFLLLFAQC